MGVLESTIVGCRFGRVGAWDTARRCPGKRLGRRCRSVVAGSARQWPGSQGLDYLPEEEFPRAPPVPRWNPDTNSIQLWEGWPVLALPADWEVAAVAPVASAAVPAWVAIAVVAVAAVVGLATCSQTGEAATVAADSVEPRPDIVVSSLFRILSAVRPCARAPRTRLPAADLPRIGRHSHTIHLRIRSHHQIPSRPNPQHRNRTCFADQRMIANQSRQAMQRTLRKPPGCTDLHRNQIQHHHHHHTGCPYY